MIFIIYLLMIFFHWLFSGILIYPFDISFDVLFVFVFLVNIYFSPLISLYFSFFAGLYADFYYMLPFGSYMFVYVLISFIINKVKLKLDLESMFPEIIVFILVNYAALIMEYTVTVVFSSQKAGMISVWFQPFLNLLFMLVLEKARSYYVRE